MEREKSNALDHELPETVPSFPSTEPPQPGKRRKTGWIWVLIALVLGLGVYYYFHYRGSAAASANVTVQSPGGVAGRMAGPIPVVLANVSKGDIGVYFNGLGAVTPIYTVTVKSQIPGYLMQVLYKEGQIVQKGQALAEIDPRPYEVMLENAQAGLARDQANLANAQVDLKRYQTLVPLRAVPEQQLATQQALVKSDEGVVQTDQAQIDTAKLDLVYCHITAPITGRVGLRLIDPGNYVTPGDSTGLVVITQIQPISVIFTLPEDQLPPIVEKMHAGARLKVEAYSRDKQTKIADGWLATIDNQIDPTTATVKMRANFDNRDGALFPNQFVNARLLVEEKHGVTLIPTATVQRNADTTYVYLVVPPAPGKTNPTVTVRQITLGTSEGEESEVTSGLVPGDQVVMTGVDKLQEGSAIRAPKSGQKGSRGRS